MSEAHHSAQQTQTNFNYETLEELALPQAGDHTRTELRKFVAGPVSTALHVTKEPGPWSAGGACLVVVYLGQEDRTFPLGQWVTSLEK